LLLRISCWRVRSPDPSFVEHGRLPMPDSSRQPNGAPAAADDLGSTRRRRQRRNGDCHAPPPGKCFSLQEPEWPHAFSAAPLTASAATSRHEPSEPSSRTRPHPAVRIRASGAGVRPTPLAVGACRCLDAASRRSQSKASRTARPTDPTTHVAQVPARVKSPPKRKAPLNEAL
jgi:hypothetical protein